MSVRACAATWSGAEPVEAFRRLAGRRGVFWLDSSLPRAYDGRFSIMGCEPRFVVGTRGQEWWLERGGAIVERGMQPLQKIEELIAACRTAPADGVELPFWGGAVGWFSYDLGRQFERVEGTAVDDLRVPDIRLAWHDAAVIWDHHASRAWLVGAGWERPAEAAMAELAGWLGAPQAGGARPEVGPHHGASTCVSDLSREDYMARVETARDSIARGEIYQVNLVQRFTCEHREDPATTYLRLRARNPAPFAV
ncbi:MAG TPA: chorismate-binding protein, partial [Opitutaceae bacterium]